MGEYQYIEDNGGNLFLFVFADGKVAAGIGNLEYAQPGEGQDVLPALREDALAEVTRWEGHLANAAETYAAFVGDSTSEVIASERGTYPDRMGAAGKRYFGIADD